MKDLIYGGKEIIYPEIKTEDYKNLYDKFNNYKNSKKAKIKEKIADIIFVILAYSYYFLIVGIILYCFNFLFYNGIIYKDFIFIKHGIYLLLSCGLSIYICCTSVGFLMFEFLRDLVDMIFKIDIVDDLNCHLYKNIETIESLDKIKKCNKENLKCISTSDDRSVLVFKEKDVFFNVKHKFLEKIMNEKGNIDYSYLDKDYSEFLKSLKKLDKNIVL